jgi:pyruvate dehydrogenase (quinone)
VAARFAAPGRPVVALAQDAPGAQAAGALALLAQLAPRLGGPPLVVAALTPARPADRLHPAAAAAEAAGVPALRCADPRRVAAAWQEALRAEGPVVVDFAVDSEITPGG